MHTFIIRFTLDCILLSLFVIIPAALKRLLRSRLSGQMQYNLWVLLLPVLFVPFLPGPPAKTVLSFLTQKLALAKRGSAPAAPLSGQTSAAQASETFGRIKDFAMPVNVRESVFPLLLFLIWTVGMAVTAAFLFFSFIRLGRLKKSARILEEGQIFWLLHDCLDNLSIKRRIPIYLAPGLKSPVITGLFCPAIFIPAGLCHTYTPQEIRHMLLHELQHYRRKDAWINHLANIARILYWFHPAVRYWLKELRLAQEIACDTAVLALLGTDGCKDYGCTLIRFAKERSLSPSPLWNSIGGNMRQMRERILNIAEFHPLSRPQKFFQYTVLLLTAAFLFFLSPVLSAGEEIRNIAADSSGSDTYRFDHSGKDITYSDLSSCFGTYEGSFVLYNAGDNTWTIYNEEAARTRTSPASTYKIYDALLGLDEGIITPADSLLSWDKTAYPFPEWEADQNLDSAMKNSVNWYFQKIDAQAGNSRIRTFLKSIAYGNQATGSTKAEDRPAQYWIDGTLKISPLEQVMLLERLFNGKLPAAPSSVDAVKEALCLQKDESGSLYGKTGTVKMNSQEVSGWFVGYTEIEQTPYFFATNIQGQTGAAGSRAYEITRAVLDTLLTD